MARVYDCGGVSVDVSASSNPVIQNLIATGHGPQDPLHIGLDVTEDCAVINSQSQGSKRLLALGPLTRGRFFEIEAIPDIRVQCAQFANQILRGHDE